MLFVVLSTYSCLNKRLVLIPSSLLILLIRAENKEQIIHISDFIAFAYFSCIQTHGLNASKN